jgi:predicted MFS family arabinose efflux permease
VAVCFFAVAALAFGLAFFLGRRRPASLSPTSDVAASRVRWSKVCLTLLVTISWSAGSFTFFSYLTLVLHAAAGVGGAGVAGELLLFGVAGVTGAYFSGRTVDARGALPVAAVALLTMALCEGALALVAATGPGGLAAIAWTSALLVGYGLGTWAVTPAQQHRLLSLAPHRTRMLLSLNATALYLGVATGSAIGGLVIASTHSIVALCGVAAAVTAIALLALAASA